MKSFSQERKIYSYFTVFLRDQT